MLNQCLLLKMRASVTYWNTWSQDTLFVMCHASIFPRPVYNLLLIQQWNQIDIGINRKHKAQASVSGLKKLNRCIPCSIYQS